MKHVIEDGEPTALSKVEYGLLFLSLVLTAGSVSCHLTATDLGEHELDRSEYETWRLGLGVAAGAIFVSFAGLVASRAMVGSGSKRRRHRHGHDHGLHRHHGHRHRREHHDAGGPSA
jgi:hypothetical protein